MENLVLGGEWQHGSMAGGWQILVDQNVKSIVFFLLFLIIFFLKCFFVSLGDMNMII